MSRGAPPGRPWEQSGEAIVAELESDREAGLDPAEARRRLAAHGHNRIQSGRRRGWVRILVTQFTTIIMLVLAIAAGLSALFGEWIDSIAILIAMAINAAIGFFSEWQSERAMAALSRMDRVSTRTLRGGRERRIDAAGLVPGDICRLAAGDAVPADLRILDSSRAEADESSLTGESRPVRKQAGPVERDATLAERASMVYKGTALVEGSLRGVVTATAGDTEIGHVAQMTQEAESSGDPLQRQLDRLSTRLVQVIAVAAIATGALGLIAGRDLLLMATTSVSLIVAAVPEGLPVVATLALARGMYRMARRNAVVRRLQAVQTLGATTVVCTDKTGTLTENRMSVSDLIVGVPPESARADAAGTSGSATESTSAAWPGPGSDAVGRALAAAVLANAATFGDDARPEPMERALLAFAEAEGVSGDEVLQRWPRSRRVPFDPDLKMMASLHRARDAPDSPAWLLVKGSPDAVLGASDRMLSREGEVIALDETGRSRLSDQNRALAERGFRVLALAERRIEYGGSDRSRPGPEADPADEDDAAASRLLHGLTVVGLVALEDPPRQDVRASVEAIRRAGIRVVMVTGDQEGTARAIAERLAIGEDGRTVVHGSEIQPEPSEEARARILEADVLVRVSPAQKLTLTELHQSAGAIVAMTGDGVNDAPALKTANIGIAMGKRGDAVARQAADIVLTDDRFATIGVAIEYGRAIFENIRRFVIYLISGNVAEILVVAIAAVTGLPLPLLPLQILYLNAINDTFPALALGLGRRSSGLMERPPRDPEEGILTLRGWRVLLVYGLFLAIVAFALFLAAYRGLGMSAREAGTISFLAVSIGRLSHVFNMRETGEGVVRNQITGNPLVWGAIALSIALLAFATYFPPVAAALSLHPPTTAGWGLVACAAIAPPLIGQPFRGLRP